MLPRLRTVLISLVLLAIPSIAQAEPASEEVETSVGKGGRDLAARLETRFTAPLAPTLGIEMHADGGEDLALLGPERSHIRFQPLLVVGVSPDVGIRLFFGTGVGGTLVMEEPFADDAASSSGATVNAAVTAGVRLASVGVPMVVQAQLQTIDDHGTAATLNFAMELTN